MESSHIKHKSHCFSKEKHDDEDISLGKRVDFHKITFLPQNNASETTFSNKKQGDLCSSINTKTITVLTTKGALYILECVHN